MTTSTPDAAERIDLGMVCSCGEDGRAEVDEIIVRATRRVAAGDGALIGRPVEPTRFVSGLIMSLSSGLDPGIDITSIAADQWFGIQAQEYKGAKFVVQCDEVEGGLAWLYLVARARADERTLRRALAASEAEGRSEAEIAGTLGDGFDYAELLEYRTWEKARLIRTSDDA